MTPKYQKVLIKRERERGVTVVFFVEGSSSEVSANLEEDEDISGFKFNILKNRKPEYSQQLDDFSTFLMRKDVQFEDLNVWDFKGCNIVTPVIIYLLSLDMGLQASQKVVSSSDPIRVLRDISQNFPSLAGPLTKLKLNSTLKQDIQYNQKRINEGKTKFACILHSLISIS